MDGKECQTWEHYLLSSKIRTSKQIQGTFVVVHNVHNVFRKYIVFMLLQQNGCILC